MEIGKKGSGRGERESQRYSAPLEEEEYGEPFEEMDEEVGEYSQRNEIKEDTEEEIVNREGDSEYSSDFIDSELVSSGRGHRGIEGIRESRNSKGERRKMTTSGEERTPSMQMHATPASFLEVVRQPITATHNMTGDTYAHKYERKRGVDKGESEDMGEEELMEEEVVEYREGEGGGVDKGGFNAHNHTHNTQFNPNALFYPQPPTKPRVPKLNIPPKSLKSPKSPKAYSSDFPSESLKSEGKGIPVEEMATHTHPLTLPPKSDMSELNSQLENYRLSGEGRESSMQTGKFLSPKVDSIAVNEREREESHKSGQKERLVDVEAEAVPDHFRDLQVGYGGTNSMNKGGRPESRKGRIPIPNSFPPKELQHHLRSDKPEAESNRPGESNRPLTRSPPKSHTQPQTEPSSLMLPKYSAIKSYSSSRCTTVRKTGGLNLDTFDAFNKRSKIRSPRSIEACKMEGITIRELYYKTLEEIKEEVDDKLKRDREFLKKKHIIVERNRQAMLLKVRGLRHRLIQANHQIRIDTPATGSPAKAQFPDSYDISTYSGIGSVRVFPIQISANIFKQEAGEFQKWQNRQEKELRIYLENELKGEIRNHKLKIKEQGLKERGFGVSNNFNMTAGERRKGRENISGGFSGRAKTPATNTSFGQRESTHSPQRELPETKLKKLNNLQNLRGGPRESALQQKPPSNKSETQFVRSIHKKQEIPNITMQLRPKLLEDIKYNEIKQKKEIDRQREEMRKFVESRNREEKRRQNNLLRKFGMDELRVRRNQQKKAKDIKTRGIIKNLELSEKRDYIKKLSRRREFERELLISRIVKNDEKSLRIMAEKQLIVQYRQQIRKENQIQKHKMKEHLDKLKERGKLQKLLISKLESSIKDIPTGVGVGGGFRAVRSAARHQEILNRERLNRTAEGIKPHSHSMLESAPRAPSEPMGMEIIPTKSSQPPSLYEEISRENRAQSEDQPRNLLNHTNPNIQLQDPNTGGYGTGTGTGIGVQGEGEVRAFTATGNLRRGLGGLGANPSNRVNRSKRYEKFKGIRPKSEIPGGARGNREHTVLEELEDLKNIQINELKYVVEEERKREEERETLLKGAANLSPRSKREIEKQVQVQRNVAARRIQQLHARQEFEFQEMLKGLDL